MTIFNNRAEGGSNGTTVTTGNSGGSSGTAWDNVVIGTAGAIVYSTAAALLGSLGYRITLGTGTTYLRWNKSEVGSRAVMRRPFKIPTGASATASISLMAMRNQVSDGLMGFLLMRTDRTVRVAPSTTTEIAASASPALSTNTLYWLELACTKGTTTSNGRIEYRITTDDGVLFAEYDTGATVNTLTTDPGQYRFGGFLSSQVSSWTTDDMDDLRAGIQASGWLGPVDGYTGSGSNSLPAFTGTAAGTVSLTGASAASLSAFTGTGAGTQSIPGASAASLPALTGTSAGTVSTTGASAASLPAFTGTAAGTTTVTGASAASLPAFTGAAAGTVRVTGSGASSTPALTGTGAGTASVAGSSAASLPALTGTGSSSDAPVTGSSAASLPGFTGTGAGALSITGAGAAALPQTTSSSAGLISITGASAASLTGFAGAGAVDVKILGDLGAITPSLTGTGAGSLVDPGSGIGSLPALVGAGAGTVAASGPVRNITITAGPSTPRRWAATTAGRRWSS